MKKRLLAIFLTLAMALALLPAAALADSTSGGYFTFNGHYYQVFEPDSITWEDAKQRCEQMGGYLATITSAEEQAFVDSLIENSGKNGLWLGAYRQQSDAEFVWLTGEPFQFTNWSAGQPDYTSRREDMLMLYTYHNSQFGKWNDLTNEGWYDVPARKMGYICEWDSAPSFQAGIPGDAVLFQGRHYKIYRDQYSWTDARDQCIRLGGHLATITSADEQEFIESLNTDNRQLWIGGYRDDAFNWYWVTGEAWAYTNWGSGEPNNQGNETRAAVWPKFWNDLRDSSGEQSGFICEWDSLGDLNDVPSLGDPSSIQEKAIRKDQKEVAPWGDRLDLPEYAEELYDTISGTKGQGGAFEREENFVLPMTSAGAEVSKVEQINVAEFSLLDLYANPGAELNSAIFSDESFYTIPANAEDRKVDCAKLSMGDLVTTPNFNGVYVTKIPYDSAFDTKKKEACEYIAAVYHAFDRDHPEVFWLSGKCKARIMVAADPATGGKEAYFFLVLADKDGFTMRAPAWTAAGSMTEGIARRDAAVAGILKTVTAADAAGKVKQLNQWLTEHNQYNTTPDLTTISNEPHESLAALSGQVGTEGPVCDGYSRAFKVLCDKLGIPCVLETGWAKTTASGTPGFHMWSLVQVGGTWYGADITWDDPSVKGFVGAKSGRENENYLLVGSETVINGLTFAQSHVVKNQAAVGGVDFNNGPTMGLQAYTNISAPALPTVEDIPATGTAYARTQTVKLDGKSVTFQCYAVKNADRNESNYVKVRDLANALTGTQARFNVGWDGKISITSNTAYQAAGGEGATPYSGNQTYKAVSGTPVSFNGSAVNLTSFQITHQGNGYTYYKLRDLGQLLNFNVRWDGSVVIETDKPFTGN